MRRLKRSLWTTRPKTNSYNVLFGSKLIAHFGRRGNLTMLYKLNPRTPVSYSRLRLRRELQR